MIQLGTKELSERQKSASEVTLVGESTLEVLQKFGFHQA